MDLGSPAPPGPAERLGAALRDDTLGGVLLISAAIAALVVANVAPAAYASLRETVVGPAALGLDLSLATWAADGLLAVFFLVVGLELKRELVVGQLRDVRKAALPAAAAVGGMVVPAAVFVAVNLRTGDGALRGWAIPTATDIAFALAVLAVVARHLPAAARTFLLTLAVVDDLLAVSIIAVFYTDGLRPLLLLAAAGPLLAFAWLVRRRRLGTADRVGLVLLALLTWGLVHESGVHATVAGVLLGFTVPVVTGRAERLEHRVRPWTAGLAVPVFAFFAAGVTLGGVAGVLTALRDPVAVGIVAGLVIGKPVGIVATSWVTTRLTSARLHPDLRWGDIAGIGVLAGIGFTVSLLVGSLAYDDLVRSETVQVAVLSASVVAAALAAVVLGVRRASGEREPSGSP